jgi:hypothetical protein
MTKAVDVERKRRVLRDLICNFDCPLKEQGDIVQGCLYAIDILEEFGGDACAAYFGYLLWLWSFRNSPPYMEAAMYSPIDVLFEFVRLRPQDFRDTKKLGWHHTPHLSWRYFCPGNIENTLSLENSNFDAAGEAAYECFQACANDGNTYANLWTFVKQLIKHLKGVGTYQAFNSARFLFIVMKFRMPSAKGFLRMSKANNRAALILNKLGIMTDDDLNSLSGATCDSGENAYLICECIAPALKLYPFLKTSRSCATSATRFELKKAIRFELKKTVRELKKIIRTTKGRKKNKELTKTPITSNTSRARRLRDKRQRNRNPEEEQ